MRPTPAALLLGPLALLLCAPALAAVPEGGVGVAPFRVQASDETDADPLPDVASLLSDALETRSRDRVVGPGALGAVQGPAVEASDVRRWAARAKVESVVVGSTRRSRAGGLDVAVELRSGHSGASEAEYRMAPSSEAALPEAVGKLAVLILADLGQEAAASSEAATRPAAVSAPGPTAPDIEAASDDGSAADSLIDNVRSNEPISIRSDELEVVPKEGGRELIFTSNVKAVHGDVDLRADRLEAYYPEGSSQPQYLIARGSVRVRQGDKRARCDEATYERLAQTIVCSGKAEVVQGCDRVRGDEIHFDLEAESVRVTGAASVLIRPEGEGEGDCGGVPE